MEGHTAAVQALIRKYGADKLSQVDPAHYADMLREGLAGPLSDRQRDYHERACSRNIKSILGTFSFSFLPFCSCLNQCNFQSIV